ncbi:recombination-associated protein RdgC [Bordetella sp. J329]|nr:recombination-associated protein RdgC [Bordetella sp. J329]
MWFKNLKLYRLSANFDMSTAALNEALAKLAFIPGNASQPHTIGWATVRDGGDYAHAVGDHLLLRLTAEQKLLPSKVVVQAAKERAVAFEAQQGYKPGRKQMKELKERIYDELLPRAFAVRRDTFVWIDRAGRWLGIDASSSARADEVLGLLAKSLSPFPVEPLYVEQSPGAAMTSWLAEDEAPAGFTIDQDTRLESAGDGRAKVSYQQLAPEPEELRRHIAQGKQCSRLALTWQDRVSFVLTDGMDIRRIRPMDVLAENAEGSLLNDDERFDSDLSLCGGEMSRMVADLIAALGGEKSNA